MQKQMLAMAGRAGYIMITRHVDLLYPRHTTFADMTQWQGGRRGVDRWGSYTRRRKWYRDAELIEVSDSTEISPARTPNQNVQADDRDIVDEQDLPPKYKQHEDDTASMASANSSTKSSGLRPGALKRSNTTGKSGEDLADSVFELEGNSRTHAGHDWGLGDDARMTLE